MRMQNQRAETERRDGKASREYGEKEREGDVNWPQNLWNKETLLEPR